MIVNFNSNRTITYCLPDTSINTPIPDEWYNEMGNLKEGDKIISTNEYDVWFYDNRIPKGKVFIFHKYIQHDKDAKEPVSPKYLKVGGFVFIERVGINGNDYIHYFKKYKGIKNQIITKIICYLKHKKAMR